MTAPTADQLHAAIRAAPEDRAVWLVLADWLAEQGRPDGWLRWAVGCEPCPSESGKTWMWSEFPEGADPRLSPEWELPAALFRCLGQRKIHVGGDLIRCVYRSKGKALVDLVGACLIAEEPS